MTFPKFLEASIVAHKQVAPAVFLLKIRAPSLARAARPGQFLMVCSDPASSPNLLPRPFSLHRVEKEDVSILYRIQGSGTKRLSLLAPQSRISILGPLGRGFQIGPRTKQHLLVAGGMGLAPMPFLKAALNLRGCSSILLYGCRTRSQAIKIAGLKTRLTTDDGSCGLKGLVTQEVERLLRRRADVQVYACGPWPMLARLADICHRFRIPCQVSLESRMACGLGACQGCVIRAADGNYLRVCSDGPVFDSRIIDWSQEPTI